MQHPSPSHDINSEYGPVDSDQSPEADSAGIMDDAGHDIGYESSPQVNITSTTDQVPLPSTTIRFELDQNWQCIGMVDFDPFHPKKIFQVLDDPRQSPQNCAIYEKRMSWLPTLIDASVQGRTTSLPHDYYIKIFPSQPCLIAQVTIVVESYHSMQDNFTAHNNLKPILPRSTPHFVRLTASNSSYTIPIPSLANSIQNEPFFLIACNADTPGFYIFHLEVSIHLGQVLSSPRTSHLFLNESTSLQKNLLLEFNSPPIVPLQANLGPIDESLRESFRSHFSRVPFPSTCTLPEVTDYHISREPYTSIHQLQSTLVFQLPCMLFLFQFYLYELTYPLFFIFRSTRVFDISWI